MTASVIIRRYKSKARFYPEKLSDDVTLEMVYIPSGSFIMGSHKDEKDSHDDERPQHLVNVPAFFMGRYPITQAEYMAIMGENPSRFKDKPDSNRRPVENVTWEKANEFCQKLSEKTGRAYQLPSESQWEYACRAMTSPPRPLPSSGDGKIYPPFHFGETISTEVANYGREVTTPVDYFRVANEFGLCDMHGNVWEWCADTWHENYEGAPTDGSAWIDELNKTLHSARGGSWIADPINCRSAFRADDLLDYFLINVGFRVVSPAPGLF